MYHYKQASKQPHGYAALLFVVTVGFIFLVHIAVVTEALRLMQEQSLATARRLQSIALADVCEAIAVTKLIASPDYRGGNAVGLGEYSCTIDTIVVNEQTGIVAIPVTTVIAGLLHSETATVVYTHIEFGPSSNTIGGIPAVEMRGVQYNERQ